MENHILVNTPEELHNVIGELIILGIIDDSDNDWNESVMFDMTETNGKYKGHIAIWIEEFLGVCLPVYIDESTPESSIFQNVEEYKKHRENNPKSVFQKV